MNLLELPLLFYVICVIAYTAQTSSVLLLPLAWSYVSLRLVHSIIHIAYNDVFHRFLAFALSNGVLIALWFVVGIPAALIHCAIGSSPRFEE